MNLKEHIKRKIIGTQYEGAGYLDNILLIFDKNLKTYAPNNILDVGCGDGYKTVRFANRFNIDMQNTCGVDYEEQRVIDCRKIFKAEKIDLEVDDLPYEDDTFDLVICNQVLEHLKNYKKVIDDLIRVTKKGGYIVVGIPNLAHLINRIYLLFGIQPICIHLDGPHVRSFAHRSFIKMLSSLDKVKLIDSKGALMYPFPMIVGKFLARYFIGLSGFTCYLLRKVK